MKQVRINSLLGMTQDNATLQREWSTRNGVLAKGTFLLVALFAGNIGPGLYMISYFLDFQAGRLAGFLIVAVGYGLPHLLFLGRMERFWRGVLKPQTSWISRGFVFANFFLVFGFLSLLADYQHLLGITYNLSDLWLNDILLLLGFISAFMLAMYPGFLFSCITAIPFWNSVLLVPLFIVQAFGAGIALAFIMFHVPGMPDISAIEINMKTLLRSQAFLITVGAVLLTIYLYGRYKARTAGKTSVEKLQSGQKKNVVLFGALACETVIPFAIVLLVLFGVNNIVLIAAALIQLYGIFFFKYHLLNAGAYKELYTDDMRGPKQMMKP